MARVLQEKLHDDGEKLGAATSQDIGKPVKSPEEKALVRKIDLYLMPAIWFLYLLAVSTS
jgi:hypothetical protein